MSETAAQNGGGDSRPESPYVGLIPYDEGDAAFFFGRTTEAAIVAANLRSTRLTILYGPSGVGKTSLLMAGAVHRLREEARAASALAAENGFGIGVFRSWRDAPLEGLQEAARLALQEAPGVGSLPPPSVTLAETLRAWTARTHTLLVVLDQFEEYFQYHPDEGGEERLTGFARELADCVNDATLPVNILLSIREDALARLDRFEGHIPALFANYLRVDHLDLDAAREAIERPVAAWNRSLPAGEQPYEIEPELVEAVLAATAGGGLTLTAETEGTTPATAGDRIEAPFLQLVLDRLWRETTAAGEHTLTLARLETLGGAARIVESHLQNGLGLLTPVEQDTASDCFRFLVTKSRTKIAHSATDLSEFTQQPEPQIAAVLEKLCSGDSGRILRAVAPTREGDSTSYELFHDILGEPIVDWRRNHEVERNRRAARRRYLRIGGVLLLLVAVFAALGLLAAVQRSDALRAKQRADEFSAVGLASVASGLREARLDAALLLGLEAYRKSQNVQVERSLISSLAAARAAGVLAILRGRQGAVVDVAVSGDGRMLASAGSGGTVILWDAHAPHARLATLAGAVTAVAFSPDGQKLAAVGPAGTIALWDTRRGTKLATLNGKQRPVHAVAFSPDGRTLATAGPRSLLLWDVAAPTRGPERLASPQSHVLDVAYSRDGRTLAAASHNGSVLFWDVRTPKKPYKRRDGNQGPVNAVAFSPDGTKLAAAGEDGRIVLWDARPPHRRLATLNTGSQSELTSVAFGNALTLAAGGRDGRVTLWDARGRFEDPLHSVNSHQSIIRSVAFGPNGKMLVSAGSDGTLRLWDTRASLRIGQPFFGPAGAFNGVAFAPDGQTLATAGDDGAVRLWDAGTYDDVGLVAVGRDPVNALAFGPQQEMLVTGSEDGVVRFWDRRTGDSSADDLDAGKGEAVYGVAISPNGRALATAASDGSVRLWDARTRSPLLAKPLRVSDSGPVNGVAFSPTEDVLASADQDGRVVFWDPSAGEKLDTLDVGEGALYGLAYTPDGRKLATIGEDKTVRFWDVRTHGEIGRIAANGEPRGIALSPDWRLLATTVAPAVWLWEGILWRDLPHLKTLVCNLVVGNLTKAEWDALAPGLEYSTTCPS